MNLISKSETPHKMVRSIIASWLPCLVECDPEFELHNQCMSSQFQEELRELSEMGNGIYYEMVGEFQSLIEKFEEYKSQVLI